MKFEKVIFIMPYSQAQFLNGKIGVEAFLEDGETVAQGLSELKRQCEEWYKNEMGQTFQQIAPSNMNMMPEREQVITLKEVNLAHEQIEIDIDNATSIDSLKEVSNKYGELPDFLKRIFCVKWDKLAEKEREIKDILDRTEERTKMGKPIK